MSKICVRVQSTHTVRDAMNLMNEKKQNCALVVDDEDYLEGILTLGDIRRRGLELGTNTSSPNGDTSTVDVSHLLVLRSIFCSNHGYICVFL
jgi:CBS domain-containing protein